MGIKFWRTAYIVLMLAPIQTTIAGENIIIERYKNWKNPVVSIFKNYQIYLYKVKYSPDGKYPTFYVIFNHDPQISSRGSEAMDNVYEDLLTANSNFPYTLIDKKRGLRIDVSWDDKIHQTIKVDMCGPDAKNPCNLDE